MESHLVAGLPSILDVKQAAEYAHMAPYTIRYYIRTGKLKATRVVDAGASKWLVRASDLLAFLGVQP